MRLSWRGASGYLMKEIDPDGLVRAVVDVSQGRSILDPETTSRVMRLVRGAGRSSAGRDDLDSLSIQERKVLSLVAKGKTNKEIADELSLSDNTVRNYLGNVYDKLHVKRRSQAAALWVQWSRPNTVHLITIMTRRDTLRGSGGGRFLQQA